MKRVCIIPARGGSKRIPRKNIRLFIDKPIIAFSIQSALSCGLFDEVMVSTDDIEIAKVAAEYGAKVPFFRTETNASDTATTVDVLVEVIQQYAKDGVDFAEICCLYPCAPFVSAEALSNAHQLFSETDVDSLVSVVKYSNPIERALQIKDDRLVFKKPEMAMVRSQDIPVFYYDAGQLYWIKTAAIMEEKRIYTDNTIAFEISELCAHDIDNEVDWQLAELKYKIGNRINHV